MTQEQVKLWHGDYNYCNDNKIVEWYDEYKKRKVQKAEIKEELMSIVWHPVRMQDWCMTEGGENHVMSLKYIVKTMFSFKFGQMEVASKKFQKQRQITDIFTIGVNKVVLSDKVSCKNGKDLRYIVDYQVDGETISTIVY